jgi:murein DD-endopeptidase MepM/ murein hydrolase activator NlpD
MWEFFKKIISKKDGEVAIVVLDENEPDTASTYSVKAREIYILGGGIVIITLLLAVLIFFATPLSSIYYQQIDNKFRDEVIAINQRVLALQDSLMAREIQLNDLKDFVRNVPDTVFQVTQYYDAGISPGLQTVYREPQTVNTFELLTRNEIMIAKTRERNPDFPSHFPVRGSLTQGFAPNIGHFGIDIAAQRNSQFRSIADGTVVNTNWTINYGNVIYIQHADGIMSIYKHAERLYKEPGDIVLKGDILGVVGDRGVLSSGSHLHLEIWKNGVPKNPLIYVN